ncbi:hypothetical protein C6988_06045 [Nitrosopumilus sp. b1]|uniref:hypothetical protein n=1 Tax=Nitrosopumilus sp. b1 TaxID=2109907 RepID=UPI0015F36984|nr:hypothetical protein [Nitrosopumilus sp. b1]KAF6242744.1 hypothetical protein C6988_06045 [Nitrosopumilus sp. b1]
MNYEKFCSDILKIDSKIRFAAVFDQWAQKVGGGMREGVKSLLSERSEKELVNLLILNWNSKKNISKWVGKTKYTLDEYDTIKRFSFYLGNDHLLLVSTEIDLNTDITVENVIKLYYKNKS